jgi:hypothetical protein
VEDRCGLNHIGWWNLEKLFDEENAIALGRRTDKVLRAIKADIAGWTAQLPDRKLSQLGSVTPPTTAVIWVYSRGDRRLAHTHTGF